MSALPADKTPWPPEADANRYRRMAKPLAWLAGDAAMLAGVYGQSAPVVQGGPGTSINGPGLVRRVVSAVLNRNDFWAGNVSEEISTKRHLGTAAAISTISAELLFSDAPMFTVLGEVDAEGEPTAATAAAQARLDELLAKCGFMGVLDSAAVIQSATGSTGLRIAFDKTAPGMGLRPVITRVDADATIPLYSWGQLVGVIFWQTLSTSQTTVWRHLEAHEAGMAYHGLYKGDRDNLGTRQPLDMHVATKHLAKLADDEGGIRITRLPGATTAVSVPNMLPDPLDRQGYAGRSDYTPAVMDLFDAIDSTHSQMLESIDDAKSRLLIADSMLEKAGAGKGKTFDHNQRVFTRVKVPPAEKEGGGLPIEKIQFEMRVAEYLSATDALIDKAIHEAGYNAQAMGDEGGVQQTATEYSGKNRRSMSTRDKKIGYWQPLLEALLTTFVAVDVEQFTPRGADGLLIKAYPVQVTFPESVQPTLAELAGIAKVLKEAGAASAWSLVKLVNRGWTDTQVGTEVDRIEAAASVIDPVSFGVGGAGVTTEDGI